MNLDLSDEWLVWDQLEPVTLTSTRRTGPVHEQVSNVRKKAVTVKDAAVSFGAYQHGDTFFYVPAVLLGSTFGDPKPGDVVLDGNQDRYTVLQVEVRRKDGFRAQTYKLTARNLAIAFDLKDSIDIESPIMMLDKAGANYVTNWEIRYRDLPARVQKISDALAEERGIKGFKGTFQVTLDRQVIVAAHDRVAWYGTLMNIERTEFHGQLGRDTNAPVKYLAIVGVKNPEHIAELPVLDCEESP